MYFTFLCAIYSSNASFRTSSNTAASIGLLLCFWQSGGAIFNTNLNSNVGIAVITDSNFKDNTASFGGNNIKEASGDVTCNDGNTFESSGGAGNDSGRKGNSPAGLCD